MESQDSTFIAAAPRSTVPRARGAAADRVALAALLIAVVWAATSRTPTAHAEQPAPEPATAEPATAPADSELPEGAPATDDDEVAPDGEVTEPAPTTTATCPRSFAERKRPYVYAIGSSTMGSVLGPILQRQVKGRWDVDFRKWGKASSGLSRPDFHDWPKEVPSLNRRYDPDIYLVSLGTNDAQPLKTKRGWIRTDNPKWAARYKQRVAKMIDLLSGKDRRRLVVWLGPTAFPAKNSRLLGPAIDRAVREAIEEFDGPAVYLDGYSATSPSPGRYIKSVTPKGSKKTMPAWATDKVHLSTEAVRWLLAEPMLEAIAPCLDGHAKDREER